MTVQHQRSHLRLAARLLTLVAAASAALAILGYVAHKASLIALLPDWQGMSLLTAAGILCVAVPLWRQRLRAGGKVATTLSALAVAAMLAVLFSHGVHHADIVSPWVAAALFDLPAAMSGRVSVATAVCLLLLALTLPLQRLGPRRAVLVVDIASNAALLIAGAALLGYAYRVSDLYGIYVFNTMSLQTAVAIVCLALARLVCEPASRLGTALRSPSLGVRKLRRMLLLPALPVALGWLLLGMGGPVSSGNGAALAMLVIATCVPMSYLLLENARAIDLLDRERRAQRHVERRLAIELQRRLDEQTAALADSHQREVETLAKAERTRRADLIAQLTGSIAHDFNNLLMVIGGCAQLLKLRMPGESGLVPLVDKVTATVGRAAKLTGQLSAFSRTQRLQAAPVQVDAVVRAALATVGATLPAGIDVVTQLAAGNGSVLSESVQLQLAVEHVIRNAGEALGERGSIHIATALQQLGDGNGQVTIRVTDTGCGMPPGQVAAATEPFFTTKHGLHHGLGLAQVHSVVQQASGVLHIDSAPNRGTTVELVLPCIAADAGVSVLPGAGAALPQAHQRLLVIDDDDDVRGVIASLLRQMQYEVIEAGDGETGLRMLEQHAPALAIIDFLMPGMNGAEVARRARSHAPHLSIIFISGYSDSNAIAAIPRSRLLRKPVMVEELARTVAAVLQSA